MRLVLCDVSVWDDGANPPFATVCTKSRIRYLMRPRWAFRLALRACRLVHGVTRYRVRDLPTAGRMLWWQVQCLSCGCRHRVETPHGWHRVEVQAELARLMETP